MRRDRENGAIHRTPLVTKKKSMLTFNITRRRRVIEIVFEDAQCVPWIDRAVEQEDICGLKFTALICQKYKEKPLEHLR